MSPGVVVIVFFLVAAAELPDKTMIATIVMGSRNPPGLVWVGAAAGLLLQASVAVAAGRLVELLPHQTLEIVVTALFFVGAALLLFVPERHERREGEAAAAQAAGLDAGEDMPVENEDNDNRGPAQEQAPPARRRDAMARLRRRLEFSTTRALESTGGARASGDAGLSATGAGARGGAGADTAGRSGRAVVPWKVVTTAFFVIAIGEFGDLTQLLLVNLVGRYHEPWAVFVGGFAGLASMSALAAFGGRTLVRWLPLAWIRRAGGLALLGFAAYGIYALAT